MMVKGLNFSEKKVCNGHFVAVLDHERHDRGMVLSKLGTRCIKEHDIHELLICLDEIQDEKVLENFVYLGFVEFFGGSVIKVGDEVWVGNLYVGKIAGFDETHMPNHINIVVSNNGKGVTGGKLGLKVGDMIKIGGSA